MEDFKIKLAAEQDKQAKLLEECREQREKLAESKKNFAQVNFT